jgi:hypothetical protein
LGLGSEAHVAAVRQRHEQARLQAKRPEDVALRRMAGRRTPEDILEVVARLMVTSVAELKRRRRNSWLRPVSAWALQRFAGLDQRMIAELLGVGTGAAVSRQLARWRQDLATAERARRVAEAITRQLD